MRVPVILILRTICRLICVRVFRLTCALLFIIDLYMCSYIVMCVCWYVGCCIDVCVAIDIESGVDLLSVVCTLGFGCWGRVLSRQWGW